MRPEHRDHVLPWRRAVDGIVQRRIDVAGRRALPEQARAERGLGDGDPHRPRVGLLGVNEEGDPSGELEEMLDVFSKMPAPIGDALRDHGAADPLHDGRPVQFVDVMPRTTDHKVDLFPEALDREAPAGLYTYQPDPASNAFPLALISPASERTISSTLSELPRPQVRLLMNPDDAAARHVDDGAPVRIYNAQGEVLCNVQIGSWIRRGTVSLPKGLWRRHTANGFTANALVPDTLTDLGGGACFNDARVEVEAVTQ
jgi:anaerobic selenocysteine-containing dehydrogenase